MSPAHELLFRGFQQGDEPHIISLFRRSFGQDLDPELWRWRFLQNASGPGVIQLAWDGETLAAHYAVSRVRLHVDGEERLSGLSGTTMSDPAYQGLGLFPKLARQVYDEMTDLGMCLVWGFPNAQSHGGFVRKLAWSDIHEVPFLRLRIEQQRKPLPSGTEVRALDRADDRFDRLWARARDRFSVATVRDQRHVRWRFLENPAEAYTLLGLEDGDDLRAYAVYKRYGSELQIVDLLTDGTTEAGLELVGAVVARATAEDAPAVSMWLPVHDALHLELERFGFGLDAPVTYFGGRPLEEGHVSERLRDYSSWHLTMADSDVF